ncbi:MAG: hypothetical protein LQ346_000888 [Caloplaca aetnensis]|nr:MAG: hypothetical protein LQ346_000888 [Caloplaca aetnensis]
MPSAALEAPKAKKTATKKATATGNATRITKAKATTKPIFPNLLSTAGGSSTTDAQPGAESSAPTAATKKKSATETKKTNATAKKADVKGRGKAPAVNESKKVRNAKESDTSESETSASDAPPVKKASLTAKKADVKGKGKAPAANESKKRTNAKVDDTSESEMSAGEALPDKKRTAATKKADVKGKGKAPVSKDSKKRKTADDEVTSEAEKSASEAPPAKRAKTERAGDKRAPKAAKVVPAKPKVVINHAPADRLHVFVFGEGSSGELGLGTAKSAIDVKRPRLNPLLPADTVGVVHLACGGMHVAALTHDGKVLTWGVNDQGALGRDTKWEGGLRDVGESDDESDSGSDSGLNPFESTPTAITTFPEGTVVVKLSAGDSHTLALTDEGLVYGWGTFRSNEGILGFKPGTFVQSTPVLLPGLKKIVDITSGANHCLARDQKGVVYTWGSGQQNQLGFRQMERKRYESLNPSLLRLRGKHIRLIACGADHSFAIDGKDQVWSWGANSFGATGIYDNAGEDNAVIISPTIVNNLNLVNDTITHLSGGTHHSIAATENGQCLVWGRFDGSQTGIKDSAIADDDVIVDSKGKARILLKPTQVPGVGPCAMVAAGTDHCLAITRDGKGYSWGFSANYQTGQGTDNDVTVATMFNNTATRDKRLNWAGAGGQYSILTAKAEVDPATADNGEGPSHSKDVDMADAPA